MGECIGCAEPVLTCFCPARVLDFGGWSRPRYEDQATNATVSMGDYEKRIYIREERA